MSLQRIQIIGFAPDLPSDTPGALITSGGVVPTARGFKAGWAAPTTTRGSQADLGTTAITGAGSGRVPSGTTSYYVGQTTKLWEITLGGASATDRSKAGGYNSTDTVDGGWSFAQFGVKTLAVNKFDTLQVATTGSSAFADVSGAPKASIVCTVGEPTAPFAMLFNYNDGTDTPDGIFWSALGDYTDWTPSNATQCGNISILEPSGPFTAAIKFRDGVVAFKESSMFLGTYVGTPTIWQWQRISSDIGCAGKGLVVSASDVIYFADQHGIWKYDGSYPQLLPGAVHNYWSRFVWAVRGALSPSQNQMVWDPVAHTLHLKLGGGNELTWNSLSGVWLEGAIGGDMVVGVRPNLPGSAVCMVLSRDSGTSHSFVTTIGEFGNTGAQMRMGYIGDPVRLSQINRVAPIWLNDLGFFNSPAGTTCDVIAFPSIPTDDGVTTNGAQNGKTGIVLDALSRYFDETVSGNYFSIALKTIAQTCEFRDVVIDIKDAGSN